MSSHFHTSKTIVSAGDDTASFFIKTPDFPMKPGEALYKVNPISFIGRAVKTTDRYEMEMRLNFREGHEAFSTYLQKPFDDGSTPLTIAAKLVSYEEKARTKQYAYMKNVPSIVADIQPAADGVPGTVQFFAILPPFTAVYVDNPDFLKTLGFPQESFTDTLEVTGRVKDSPDKVPYGWYNMESTILKVPSAIWLENDQMDLIYNVIRGQGRAAGQFKLEIRYFTDWLPVRSPPERLYDRVVATETLADLFDDGLVVLGLKRSVINVEAEGTEGIAIQSLTFPEAMLEVEVKLSPKLKHYFKLEDPHLRFPLDDPRRLILTPRDELVDDIFEQDYPVYLVLRGGGGFAENNMYLEGRGNVPALGVMLDPTTFLGHGVTFFGSTNELQLLLLDKETDPIIMKNDSKFILTIEITPFVGI